MWVGGERAGDDQVKEKMSIKSECGDSIGGEPEGHSKLNGRVRKVQIINDNCIPGKRIQTGF